MEQPGSVWYPARMLSSHIEHVSLLLFVGAVVAMLARKAHLPYTVGLLLTGFGLAFLNIAPDIHLTKDLIFSAFLPPLIFEAAVHMSWKGVRRDLRVTLTLATLGVLVAVGFTGLGMHLAAGWAWPIALLFGVLIAATDPVSVIATFKENPVPERLKILVEAESLFNDGTAAVLFGIALAVVQGGQVSAGGMAVNFAVTVIGGLVCGAVVAGAMLLLSRGTDDYLIELTFTTVIAYGSFLLAEHFHLSGVLATLTAGLLVGNVGSESTLTNRGREAVGRFWEFMAFLANSLVFLLIGQSLAHLHITQVWRPILIAIPVVLAGRALAVYACCALYGRGVRRIPGRYQHVLFWGGLRGALALALVLGLPQDMAQRPLLITVVFAVVAFSIVVQGLSIPPLLKRLGLVETPDAPDERPAEGVAVSRD